MVCRTTRLNLQCVRVVVGELEGAKAETRVVHADAQECAAAWNDTFVGELSRGGF